MNKLEVGMYVRTKKGIRKIIKIDEDNNYYIDKTYINDFRQEIDCISDSCIIGEPSNNIIDLIEVGDYVNGYPVAYITDLGNEFGKRLNFGDETCVVATKFNYDKVYIYKEDIKSIVTKEQFSSMEYRLG